MPGKWIEIAAGDGGKFRGYLTLPAGGKGPGIVLCQEIFGINAYVREVADYYAEEGYVVLAPDLFWRLDKDVDLGYTEADWKKAFDYFQRFDVDKGVQDITAAVKALRACPEVTGKIGALGFCLGGKLAYLAAARSGVDVAIGYYGVGIEGSLNEPPKCPTVLHFAEKDKFVPAEAVQKIKDALKDRHDVEIYVHPGQDHAFARTGGDHYDKPSALMAHHRSIAAIRRVMGPHFDFSALWDTHCMHEFGTRDVDATMRTMVAQPYVNHIPTMTGGVGTRRSQAVLQISLHSDHTGRHETGSDLADHRRGHPGRRDAVLLHSRHRDRLDAARREADRKVRRDPSRRDRQVPWRQALQRAHLLGSGIGAGADRIAEAGRPARRRRRDRSQTRR
jgi:carboxymethylenebutenolidase